jgi:hypothetical protein|tara:strand:+ start:48218 stop:48709 length:492 start_codon:yes stop_codon:yes gene_type:complete
MKLNILGGLCFSIALFSCSNSKVADSANFVEYGPYKVETTKAIPVAAMLTDFNAKGNERSAYTIAADIEEVCSKAGCWINIQKSKDETLMVRFKDHFTIPMETKVGTKAFLHGELYADTVSVDMLRHFAEDAGKAEAEIMKITQPKITTSFEADGIKFVPAKK